MIAISLCMIVKNEEKTLARCLSSIAPAMDEIIIVDTGSTDATREIAADFTERVESFTWGEDFAAARNFAFSLATKPYVMWLDADDVLEVAELHKLKALKHQLDDTVDSVSMDYHLTFDEFGSVVNKLRRNRIVKRERGFQWIGAVHEYLEVHGNIVHSDVVVTHKSLGQNSDRNLNMYENRLRRGEVFTPRDLFYYANELKDNGRYELAIRYYDNFLATGKGWIEDNILACGRLADCYNELNEPRNMMDSVLRSFYYDKPRAEFCCRLGHYFLQRDELQMAVFWYKQALNKDHTSTIGWGFENIACSTWLPQLQLCVCYDRLGDYEAAYMHNEQAGSYRPKDKRIISNREYLSQRIGKRDEEVSCLSEKKKRVLIASPVQQQPTILALFLTSLKRLHADQLDLSYLFIDDNNEAASSELLEQFATACEGATIIRSDAADSQDVYVRTDTTHCWNEQLIWKVADFKNRIIELALEQQYDYLFLLDSDLLLDERTLEQLVSDDKDIVSEIFWTCWQPDARPQPQVWLHDEYSQWEQGRGERPSDTEIAARLEQFFAQISAPGVYEVGGLGACTLLSRRALQAGVHFGPISNLTFWGEDRHFCIRAAALGFRLFVDTHYPAYHIYRSADLDGAERYLQKATEAEVKPQTRGRLTLSMVVRNESRRYLRQVLEQHRQYIDDAVIIDDGSTDDTAEICLQALEGIPVKLIRNEVSRFSNEITLRKQQWEETLSVNPEWILNLDADEWFEPSFVQELDTLLRSKDTNVYCFRLYDFWNPHSYRADAIWRAHESYRPFLLRYDAAFDYKWKNIPQHCGRFPANILELPHRLSNIRLKHYGWAKEEHRREKLRRYQILDPEAKYGWKEQYLSILDKNPQLVEWQE